MVCQCMAKILVRVTYICVRTLLYRICLGVVVGLKKSIINIIEFNCDNLAVVYPMNTYTAKDPHFMKLIRRLVIQALRFNIFFSARHIPGLRNVIADKLSRLQMVEFRRVAPYMDKEQTVISHLVNNP